MTDSPTWERFAYLFNSTTKQQAAARRKFEYPPSQTKTLASFCWLLLPPGCLKFSLPPSGWEFKQGMDSNGYDVTNVPNLGGDWAKLIAACDATPGCKYANTGGW